jgi:hypothetical protein
MHAATSETLKVKPTFLRGTTVRTGFNSIAICALAAALTVIVVAWAVPAAAQGASTETAPAAGSAILNVVRWTGSLPEATGQTVEVRFALYQDQAGGLTLWSETQTVKVGPDGRYSVLLGGASAEGLPAALFQDGEARWLEARLLSASSGDTSAETAHSTLPARSLIAAVPYAFKAVDAETLAGRAAADYVTREDLPAAVVATAQAAAQANPETTPTGSGTAGTVPLWTGSATLGNSMISEKGTKVGIGIASPATTLDVNGASTLRGSVSLPPDALATAKAGVNSPALEFGASVYSSTAKAAEAKSFAWRALSSGNGTTAPTAALELLFGSGTASPAATGLSFAPSGQITFASGQKFPGTGAGTITGVIASSPLTGGGTTGAVTVGLSTTALKTTLNSVYAQLGATNTFTAPITFAPSQTFPGTGTLTGITAGTGLTGGGSSGAPTLSVNPALVPMLAASNTFTGATNTFANPVAFAASQTFPGTLSGVTAAGPLTQNTTGGIVSLGLSTPALETNLNSVYAQLGAANTFTKPIVFASGQTFPGMGTLTGVTAGTGLIGGGTSGSPTLAVNTTLVPLLNAQNSFTNNNTFLGTIGSQGTIDLESPGVTSSFAPNLNSALLELSANAYNSTQGLPEALNFGWQAVASGGNTASPSANLELLYGTGSTLPVATGLSIAPSGIINFASGQTFPGGGGGGGGSITAVTTSSPLTGSGTSGTVNLGLNASSLEATLNGVYAQLGAANTFVQPITFAASQTFPNTVGNIVVSSPLTQSGTSSAVILGLNTAALDSTFAQLGETNLFTGALNAFGGSVQATTAGIAFKGTSTGGNYGVLGQSSVGSGVVGNAEAPGGGSAGVFGHTGNSFSEASGTEGPTEVAGVWGDTTGNPVSGDHAAGVIGTADNAEGGSFFNNSGSYAAVSAENQGAGTGISGTSDNGGIGVVGVGATGMEGTSAASSGAGVTGVATAADADGVFGTASGEGSDGVYGQATGTFDSNFVPSVGVRGLAIQNTGAVGVMGTSIGTSAVGKSLLGLGDVAGVWGDAFNGPNVGYFPNQTSVPTNLTLGGVAGTADDNIGGYFENNSNIPTVVAFNNSDDGGGTTGLFRTFMASTLTGTCGIGAKGDLACTGQMKSLVSASGGARRVETYAMQSPENWMEDFGSGLLERGLAVVKIDPAFAETVTSDASYHVFITPNGDCNGLYVIRKTATGFEVRESKGGTSSLTFDYRIVAKRRGYEAERLTDVTERFNAETLAAMPRRAPVGQQRSAPPPELRRAPAPRGTPTSPSATHQAAEKPAAIQVKSPLHP